MKNEKCAKCKKKPCACKGGKGGKKSWPMTPFGKAK